ncbi:hypothetical protein GCM10010245_90060 [Streptomyces spectabilis]|uniref:Uncharacterized protein n=1 Tax=Streptomyces spectabilis TaxID=68270 RepID=A0A7W8EZD6_STRST|nr:hypothetical protein [Streptomyces spectabilis]GGV57022.1 hypothetical protein GCM10010245_90060 [Streptomyces spectabilis]
MAPPRVRRHDTHRSRTTLPGPDRARRDALRLPDRLRLHGAGLIDPGGLARGRPAGYGGAGTRALKRSAGSPPAAIARLSRHVDEDGRTARALVDEFYRRRDADG